MFQRRVLNVAVEEINEKTDLQVAYEVERIGRKVLSIRFVMKINKNGIHFINNSEISEKLKSL